MTDSPRRAKPGAQTLDLLQHRFDQIAGDAPHIDVESLKEALGLKSEYLAQRMLAQLDTDADGSVSRAEFMEGVRKLVYGTDNDRLTFAFRLHDHDGDGYLSQTELERMIAIGLAEDDIEPDEEHSPETLALGLLQALDADRDGRVSFAELERLVRARPELLHEMARAEALWMAPGRDVVARLTDETGGEPEPNAFARFVENHVRGGIVLAAFALMNVGLFVATYNMVLGEHVMMRVGRATGAALAFDAGVVLVPVARRFLTRLRASFLGRLIPIDSAVAFHKVVGHTFFFGSLAHVGAFVASYSAGHDEPITHALFETKTGLTGSLLVVIFVVMWIAALGFFRRSRRFEIFYFTHLLYAPLLVLLVIHAPHVLLWLGLPLLGFGVEQLFRALRRGRRARILAIEPLKSGVTRVEIERPLGFSFSPADYVFVRIPAVAKHEWHPFTISSAPERDTITLHVRSLGNWTEALRSLAEARSGEAPDDLFVFLDGPYGSPSAHIFQSRVAVLIGAGIGVTPFASVLESIVSREDGSGPNLDKAHFFWLNRDQRSFEWFRDLLAEVERRDARDVLELHLHMTGGRTGATAFGLEAARELAHAYGRTDLATGLRAKTRMSAPSWKKELAAIKKAHRGEKVSVYFCGPPGLGAKVRRACESLGMPFREEVF